MGAAYCHTQISQSQNSKCLQNHQTTPQKQTCHTHQQKMYVKPHLDDGYKLTYLGYDYLALKSFMSRGHIQTVNGKIGIGK